METDEEVTEEQQSVLSEMQRYDNFGWTIMNKRHTYTDGQSNHHSVFTDGLIIAVKKTFLRIVQELFVLICVNYPNYLGEGM